MPRRIVITILSAPDKLGNVRLVGEWTDVWRSSPVQQKFEGDPKWYASYWRRKGYAVKVIDYKGKRKIKCK